MWSSSRVGAQQVIYSQYAENQVPYNPNYSLIGGAGSVDIIGRRQWIGIEGAPSSFLLTGNVPFPEINASAGLVVMQDKFAVEQLSDVKFFFAKGIQLSENDNLAVSLSAGYQNYKAIYSDLDPIDPQFNTDIREGSGVVGSGIMLFNPEKYYIGLALPGLSIRKIGNASIQENGHQKNTYFFVGGYLFNLSYDSYIKPSLLVSYSQNLPVLADISATVYIKEQLGLGFCYRNTKEISGNLSYLFDTQIHIGYSYQVGVGNINLKANGNSSHEFTLGYRFGNNKVARLL